jgi:cell pole-organizing protein PopZ
LIAAEAAAEPEPVAEVAEPEPVAEVVAEEEDDVLELTEPVATADSIGDLDVFSSPAPEPQPMPAQPVSMDDDALVGAPAAAAAVSAFSQLSSRVAMPPAGQTLDDVVRELLRPLLKEWLDANLAGIVQAKVDEEVERLARRRGV